MKGLLIGLIVGVILCLGIIAYLSSENLKLEQELQMYKNTPTWNIDAIPEVQGNVIITDNHMYIPGLAPTVIDTMDYTGVKGNVICPPSKTVEIQPE